jgi:hypothetical protein
MAIISDNLSVGFSINGVPVYGTNFAKKGYSVKLTADTEQAVTVPPGNFQFAVVRTSSGSNVQVSPTEGESLPSGTLTETSASMGLPVINVNSGDILYFRSPTDDYLYISFYRNLMQ